MNDLDNIVRKKRANIIQYFTRIKLTIIICKYYLNQCCEVTLYRIRLVDFQKKQVILNEKCHIHCGFWFACFSFIYFNKIDSTLS